MNPTDLVRRWYEWARAHGHLQHAEGLARDSRELLDAPHAADCAAAVNARHECSCRQPTGRVVVGEVRFFDYGPECPCRRCVRFEAGIESCAGHLSVTAAGEVECDGFEDGKDQP